MIVIQFECLDMMLMKVGLLSPRVWFCWATFENIWLSVLHGPEWCCWLSWGKQVCCCLVEKCISRWRCGYSPGAWSGKLTQTPDLIKQFYVTKSFQKAIKVNLSQKHLLGTCRTYFWECCLDYHPGCNSQFLVCIAPETRWDSSQSLQPCLSQPVCWRVSWRSKAPWDWGKPAKMLSKFLIVFRKCITFCKKRNVNSILFLSSTCSSNSASFLRMIPR